MYKKSPVYLVAERHEGGLEGGGVSKYVGETPRASGDIY